MLPGGDSGLKEAAPDPSRTSWNAPWWPPMRASRRSSRIPCPGLRGEESLPAGTAPLMAPGKVRCSTPGEGRLRAGSPGRIARPQTSYSLVSWRGYGSWPHRQSVKKQLDDVLGPVRLTHWPLRLAEITQLLQRLDGFPASVKVWHPEHPSKNRSISNSLSFRRNKD